MTQRTPPDGFCVPDFAAPFDFDRHLAELPVNATVKGTIVESAFDSFRAANLPPPTTKKYQPFRDYPMRELLELQVAAARAIHPDLPLREALRRVGKHVFPVFAKTLIGKMMFGVFGSNVTSILKLANKSFEMTQNTGKITTTSVSPNAVVLLYKNTHTFLDSNHFGILEGTLEALGVDGQVWFRQLAPYDGEFHVTWERVAANDAQATQ